jgi:hypothetical protein
VDSPRTHALPGTGSSLEATILGTATQDELGQLVLVAVQHCSWCCVRTVGRRWMFREIDGAPVLRWANVRDRAPSGGTRHVVGGFDLCTFAALAIARYEGTDGVYLLYCDEEWNSVSDTYQDTVELAVEQAIHGFGPVDFLEINGSDLPQKRPG